MSELNNENVGPLPQQHVHRIAGIRLNLGRMTGSELIELELHCTQRLEDAQSDLALVQQYRGRADG